MMDPWLENGEQKSCDIQGESSIPEETHDEEIHPSEQQSEKSAGPFDNNFHPYVQLPDATEYLDRLEKKLKKVQATEVKKSVTSKEILSSLEETRESYMMRLLHDTTTAPSEGNCQENDDVLNVNYIAKKIAPEKQAITVEELVHLIKADQLATMLQDEESETASTLGLAS